MTRALVVVDVQNDFCEGGTLAVPGGTEVAYRIANNIRGIRSMDSSLYDYIVATKDFHDARNDNGGHFGNPPDFVDSWPAHCVAGSAGSDFHPAIVDVYDFFDVVFYKGQGKPAYSGFQGRTNPISSDKGTSLDEWLKARGVDQLTICGIATDYCVKATALDAIDLGYHVRVPLYLTVAVGGEEARSDAIMEINEKQDVWTLIN